MLHVMASGTKCICMASCRISCQADCRQLPAAARQVGACGTWGKVNTEMQDSMMDQTPPGASPWQLSREAGFWVARPPTFNLALRQAAIKQALLMGTLHPASLKRHSPSSLQILLNSATSQAASLKPQSDLPCNPRRSIFQATSLLSLPMLNDMKKLANTGTRTTCYGLRT